MDTTTDKIARRVPIAPGQDQENAQAAGRRIKATLEHGAAA
jgi:hypothetical protein